MAVTAMEKPMTSRLMKAAGQRVCGLVLTSMLGLATLGLATVVGGSAAWAKDAPLLAVYPILISNNATLKSVIQSNDLDLNALALGTEEALKKSKKFKIFERDTKIMTDTVLKEQELAACGNDGKVNSTKNADGSLTETSCKKLFEGNAAKTGALKNVEFIVQILLKDIDLREPTYAPIEEFPGKFRKTTQGALDVSVKVIDTTSGEIKFQDTIIVKMANKPEVVSEKKAIPPRDVWKSMSSRGGKEVGERIISSIYPTFEVVKVTGKQIMIKGGITNGIDVDQEYEIYSVTDEIIDPKTKENLGSEEVLLGEVVVKRVTEKVSYAEAIDKLEDKPKAGDIIRRK
jgi:hypothetical protein